MIAIVVVAFLLFSKGGKKYTVNAYFINAAQLVKGNLVQIGGTKVGTVKDLRVTPSGHAKVKLEIQPDYAPLRQGTQATIRQASLSGIANRYVDLTMPPGDEKTGNTIPSGGSIDLSETTTAVDLDQIFNMLDPKTRQSLQAFFRNSAKQFKGKTREQRLAYRYLNPALSTSSRLFSEFNRDQGRLERFLVDSAELVTHLAEKRDEITALITNLNTTFRALGNQRVALAEVITLLPGFMRQANTTFVDLRAALDDVDLLVDASKPVVPKLNRLLIQLRPFVDDLRPTIRDLSTVVYKPGRANDLYELQQSFPPAARAALDTRRRSVNFGGGRRSVGRVPGAFPATSRAVRQSTPILAFQRPFTPDLMGWFDDFSSTGLVDAGGSASRLLTVFNVFSLVNNAPQLLDLTDRLNSLEDLARTKQYKRCPGGGEVRAPDGSNVLTAEEQRRYDCTESARGSGIYPENTP